VYWRYIPQVIANRGRETAKVQLLLRFETAIDRAACVSALLRHQQCHVAPSPELSFHTTALAHELVEPLLIELRLEALLSLLHLGLEMTGEPAFTGMPMAITGPGAAVMAADAVDAAALDALLSQSATTGGMTGGHMLMDIICITARRTATIC
jgi:hypothetical protein